MIRKANSFAGMSALLALALFSAPVFGQLAWEAKQLEFKPMAGERSLTAKFKFQNAGRGLVKILNIQTSCGCMTVGTAKSTYQPGEKGEVEVIFLFGGRRGPQNKTIVVQTDDPKEPAALLTLKADILELVKVRPSYLYWKRGAEKAPQTMTLKMMSSIPARVVSVASSDPRFAAELRSGGDGKEYEVVVTPLDTGTPAMATVTIQTDYPPDKPESVKAYAQVK